MKPYLVCLFIITPFSQAAAQDANTQLVRKLLGQPVVRVNHSVLTEGDLVREMYTIFPYARTHNGFPKTMEADIRRGALQMIEFEELVYQEALRRRLTVSPERMQRALKDYRGQFNSEADYKSYLNTEMSGSEEVLKAGVRRSLLIEQVLKSDVVDRGAVSVAEARTYYNSHPERFRIPDSFSFQTISILPPDKASPAQLKEAAKRAGEALTRAQATKNYNEFGWLAEKISEDDYRVNMGDHKAVDRAKLPPMVMQALLGLQPGQVSGLIVIDQAYCIVRLNSKISAGMKSFEEVKDSLRDQLTKEKNEHLRSTLNKKLRATARVEEL